MSHTTLQAKDTGCEVLLAALELSAKTWKVALGARGRTRQVTIGSGEFGALWEALAQAKQRFGLDAGTQVVSCYEAGRDGFWIHRELERAGMTNLVVDAASIEVNRRQRRAKTDRLDAGRLLAQLQRYHGGEAGALRPIAVPSLADEDARRPHRELGRLRQERTSHSNRIRSLLVLHGVRVAVHTGLPAELATLGGTIPPQLQAEVLREYERWDLVNRQIHALEGAHRKELAQQPPTPQRTAVRQLSQLRGLAEPSARTFVYEFFGWREFTNRRQVASAAGLTPTPYASGSLEHEQGISKAGNRRIRAMVLEIAWGWLRFQPTSSLTQWFHQRFTGSPRLRRVGIVALARRLLIALWRYVRDGVIPEGAQFKPAARAA